MFLCIIFLAVSLCAFTIVLYDLLLLKHGQTAQATVLRVEHAIATGLRSFLTVAFKGKKNEALDISCDYILQLAYADDAGQAHEVSVSVPALLKIKNGQRFRYFREGDTLAIRYRSGKPSSVQIDDPEIIKRQRFVPKLILWGACVILSAAILAVIIIK